MAVRRHLAGESYAAIAASLEVHPRTVAKWMLAHRQGGTEALKSRKATGRPTALKPAQVGRVRRIIVGKNPMQLNFGSALWTLPILQDVIAGLFGVVLHQTTISRMLNRLGLTPQRPLRRAFQRDDAWCERWASVDFPEIVKRAKKAQATLLFADETGVHENSPVATTWGERGKRPVVTVSGQRRKINVISAVSPRGRLWFRCFSGNLNHARFIEFLGALIHDIKGRVVLVIDRHPAHIAAPTRRWLHENRARIGVHFLPPYAPDMNPDEHVWSYLKGLFRREPLWQGENLQERVQDSMADIARDNALVRTFFAHPEVAYVKAALNW